MQNLNDMSLDELWELFPVVFVDPNPDWPQRFECESERIGEALRAFPIRRISHIGSTAIDGIKSKDIVDILIEVDSSADLQEIAHALETSGYIIMATSENRISLNRGYTPQGYADEVFHVHLRYAGDNDELCFRDHLNAHPRLAKEYEELKLELWKTHAPDRDAYTDAKSDFVNRCVKVAKMKFACEHTDD